MAVASVHPESFYSVGLEDFEESLWILECGTSDIKAFIWEQFQCLARGHPEYPELVYIRDPGVHGTCVTYFRGPGLPGPGCNLGKNWVPDIRRRGVQGRGLGGGRPPE